MVSLQHVCAVWRGSKDAQRATLTQRVLRISNWTSPNSKSIFSNLWTIDYTFLRQISLWLKNSLSTGWSNPASFWSTRPSKEGWSSQTLTASRMTSAIFSAGLPPGKHKRNRLPKVRVWKGRNCVETKTWTAGGLRSARLMDKGFPVHMYMSQKDFCPFELWEICRIFV